MASLRMLAKRVGAKAEVRIQGTLRTEDLAFAVQIKDVRVMWGRIDYLVSPMNGYGEKWVSADRVKVGE